MVIRNNSGGRRLYKGENYQQPRLTHFGYLMNETYKLGTQGSI
jgi:hypothetical protein